MRKIRQNASFCKVFRHFYRILRENAEYKHVKDNVLRMLPELFTIFDMHNKTVGKFYTFSEAIGCIPRHGRLPLIGSFLQAYPYQ